MSVVRPATDQDREDLIRDVSAGINSFDREQVLSLIARIDQERAARKRAEDSEEMSFGCFRMIAEDLHHFDPTTPIESVPPMFLNDWLRKVVVVYKRRIADLEAEIAKLKASAT